MKKVLEIVKKYKGYLVCIAIIILASLSIFIQNIEKDNSKTNTSNNDIGVYIVGEVNNPGVYYIKKNSRLCDLIDVAGGVANDADLDVLNMAKLLNDGDKIEIPKKKTEEKIQIEHEEKSGKVNINSATKEELMSLTSIGSSTADKIIKYRQEFEFKQIEDIMNVSGIGESKFNNIKDSITVD